MHSVDAIAFISFVSYMLNYHSEPQKSFTFSFNWLHFREVELKVLSPKLDFLVKYELCIFTFIFYLQNNY